MSEQKTCAKCGETKELEGFDREMRGRLGRQSQCRECRALYRKRNRNVLRQKQASYRTSRRDILREKQSEYRARNRDVDLRRKRDYGAASPHIAWAKTYRERAIGELVVENFTKEDVIAKYGDACTYCGGPFEHLDHYVPVHAGGVHTLANVRPSCASCNQSKRNKLPEEWD